MDENAGGKLQPFSYSRRFDASKCRDVRLSGFVFSANAVGVDIVGRERKSDSPHIAFTADFSASEEFFSASDCEQQQQLLLLLPAALT